MEERSHHRWRSPVHEKLVGARVANRLRAHLHSPGSRFSSRRRQEGTGSTHLCGWSGRRLCNRCGIEIRQNQAMGEGRMKINLIRLPIIAAICLLLIYPSHGYQAPARQAGGGFTQPDPIDFNDHEGWTQIFDGRTLQGWDGSPEVWHVENGSLVGESSPEHPSGTTNIIWRGGQPANFELKLEMKLEGTGANGGIQYRSQNVPPKPPVSPLAQKFAKWNMKGYQADFDYGNGY